MKELDKGEFEASEYVLLVAQRDSGNKKAKKATVEVVYHGTSAKYLDDIFKNGIQPNAGNGKNEVFASTDKYDAVDFGLSKAVSAGETDVVILTIDLSKAGMKDGIFSNYRVSEEPIPPEAIVKAELYTFEDLLNKRSAAEPYKTIMVSRNI
jgi:RNA:NAD 2'-phosphotransferase (TPT1/KptA family)